MTSSAMCLHLTGGRTPMDRISESLLAEFSSEHGLTSLDQDKQFEHFTSFITVRRHYSETFETEDIVTGAGGDTGIDGIAIIVNGILVTDVEAFEEQASVTDYLDVTFVFVQAERSSGFDSSKIGTFGYGVVDFFSEKPTMIRNDKIFSAAEIMNAIYKRSSKFKRGNPVCRLYYVTTGKWQDDQVLEARRVSVVSDLKSTLLFREVDFQPIDSERLHKFYRETRNAITREFDFPNKAVVPTLPGIKEAYIGILSGKAFLNLLTDDNGEMLSVLFYDNVRDWLDFNAVNNSIKDTLESEKRARFVLMNNGITVIARHLQVTGNKFLIEDYSIVNGCQTSHVLVEGRDSIDDTVMVPLRLISTQDEDVINDIIRATNKQTQVTEDQFYALEEFPKDLERFFLTYPDPYKLYFERRTSQYSRLAIEKTRIITQKKMIMAFGGMFLDEPHTTTRNYANLRRKVGTGIFAKNHRMEPYYTAAFTLYKLDYFFRSGRLEAKFKNARFHILLAARILANPTRLPRMNSHDMERYCKGLMEILWDDARADDLLTRAAEAVEKAAAGDYQRDNIRSESFTAKVKAECQNALQIAAQEAEPETSVQST